MIEFILSDAFTYLMGVAAGAYCQYIAPVQDVWKAIKEVWNFWTATTTNGDK